MAAGLYVKIEGRVQGVGFRFFVKEHAQKLNLVGWVRNTFEGNVEAYAEGEKEKLEQWLTFLHQGPRSSFVIKIDHDWKNPEGKFKSFQIVATL